MVHPTCVSIATLRSQRQSAGEANNKKDVTNSLSSCPSIKLLSQRDQPLKPTGDAPLKYFPKVADFGDIIAFLSRQSYLPELSKSGSNDIEQSPPKQKGNKPIPLERQLKRRKEEKDKVWVENVERKVSSPCSRVSNIDNRDAEKNLGKESEDEVKTVELKTIEPNQTGVTPPPFKFTDLLDITKSRRPQRYQNRSKQTQSPDKNQGPIQDPITAPPRRLHPKPIMIETSFLDNSPYIIPEKKSEKEKLPFDDDKDGPLIIPLDSEKAKLFESLNSYTPQVPFIPPPPLWSMVSTQLMIDPPSYSPPSSPPPFYQPPSPEYTNPPPPIEDFDDENVPRFRSNTLTYLHEVKGYLSMTRKRNQVKQKLYHLQLEAPKPKLIPCQTIGVYGPPHYGEEFHGAISREEADRLLTNGGEGSYLVRESQRARGSYTLGISLLGATKNFRLYFDGQHYVADKRFDTVHDLVADGLITMYVETKAADYIGRIEFEEPIYDRYSKATTFMRPAGSNGSTPLSMPPDSPPGPPTGHQMVDGRPAKPFPIPHQVEKDHVFKVHTFVGLNWCMFCGNFLWGLKSQGVKCTDCGLSTHKQCSKRVPKDCTPDLRLIKRVYGVDLTTLARAHGVNTSLVVERCVQEIESRGLEVEGLYRIPGMQDDVELIKQRFDKDGILARIGFKEFPDTNAISGAMKLYLRELPIPLVPFKMYTAFMVATKIQHNGEKLDAFCVALDELYQTFAAHYHTLKLLMGHLVRVSQLHEENKMSVENLGIVFGPTLMRPPSNQPAIDDLYMLHFQKKSVEIMIEEYDVLFQK